MKKVILACLLSVLALFALAACGDSETDAAASSANAGASMEAPISSWETASSTFEDVLQENGFVFVRGESVARATFFNEWDESEDNFQFSLLKFATEYESIEFLEELYAAGAVAGPVRQSEGISEWIEFEGWPDRNVIRFGEFVFDSELAQGDYFLELHVLLDELGYFGLEEMPTDPIQNFYDVAEALESFRGNGFIERNVLRFSNDNDFLTASLFESDSDAVFDQAQWEEHNAADESVLDYKIVRLEPFVHTWIIDEHEDGNLYYAYISNGALVYHFFGPVEQREKIDRIVEALGF